MRGRGSQDPSGCEPKKIELEDGLIFLRRRRESKGELTSRRYDGESGECNDKKTEYRK